MNKKKAFTLIEIMVVVSIFILLGGSVVFYFNDFLKSNVLLADFEKIESFFDIKERYIKNQDIHDCQFFFQTGTYFSFSCDNYDSKEASFSGMNYKDSNFDIQTNVSLSETWEIDIFGDDKLQSIESLFTMNTFSFTGGEFKEYRFESSFSGIEVNTLGILYWSEENLGEESEKYLILEEMWTQEDKSGQSLTGIIFSHNQAGKQILSGGKKYDEVYLFFTQGGYEQSLKININE